MGKRAAKPIGADTQRIYDDHMVAWTEMDVFVGIPHRESAMYSIMKHAPFDDGTRRCARLKYELGQFELREIGTQYLPKSNR